MLINSGGALPLLNFFQGCKIGTVNFLEASSEDVLVIIHHFQFISRMITLFEAVPTGKVKVINNLFINPPHAVVGSLVSLHCKTLISLVYNNVE